MIAPWEVADLDQATIDVIVAYVDDYPQMQKGMSELEAIKQQFRSKHPTYRKH